MKVISKPFLHWPFISNRSRFNFLLKNTYIWMMKIYGK